MSKDKYECEFCGGEFDGEYELWSHQQDGCGIDAEEEYRQSEKHLENATNIIKELVRHYGYPVEGKTDIYTDGGINCMKDALNFLQSMGVAHHSKDGKEYSIYEGN